MDRLIVADKLVRLDRADYVEAAEHYPEPLAHVVRVFGNLRVESVTVFGDKAADDRWVRHLKGIQELDYLDLTGTSVTDAMFKEIQGLPALTVLRLSNTKISGEGLSRLRNFQSLEYLDLSDTNVTDCDLERLGPSPRLSALELKNTRITSDGLQYLYGWSSLEFVTLDGTDLDDRAAVVIASWPSLKRLTIGRTHLSADAVETLIRLPGLVSLKVEGNGIPAEKLQAWAAARPDMAIWAPDFIVGRILDGQPQDLSGSGYIGPVGMKLEP